MRVDLRIAIAAAAASLTLVALGAHASADDTGKGCGLPASGRPACTVLRPPKSAPAERGTDASLAPQCIVLVGGLDSRTDAEDRFFEPLLAVLPAAFRRIHFGVEPDTLGHAYQTDGEIGRNGESLRALIRDLSPRCEAIHLISHSMGGAVADRALSKGDLPDFGVVTYVALSGPHNGAYGARAVRRSVETSETFGRGVGGLARTIEARDREKRVPIHDITSAAVRDLAALHPPRPPRDVEFVRLRLVNDEIVLHRDNADRRVDVREYMNYGADQREGHGGIVRNALVRDVLEATVRTHHVPAEDRSEKDLRAVADASAKWDAVFSKVHEGVGAVLFGGAAATEVVVRLGETGIP